MSAKTLTNQQFIDRAVAAHGKKYNYAMVQYARHDARVTIICPTHGPFQQTPTNHIHGVNPCACPECGKMNTNRVGLQRWLERATAKHNAKYDYSQVAFTVLSDKVTIVCPDHGPIIQTAREHTRHKPKCCARNQRLNTATFVARAKLIHADRNYDYSQTVYKRLHSKVKIHCPTHGVTMEQTPHSHLKGHALMCCGLSLGERAVMKWLIKHDIKHELQAPVGNTRLRFDFFVPAQHTAIEYNGEYHYRAIKNRGGEKRLQAQQKRDQRKAQYCADNNIRLIVIDCRNDSVDDSLRVLL